MQSSIGERFKKWFKGLFNKGREDRKALPKPEQKRDDETMSGEKKKKEFIDNLNRSIGNVQNPNPHTNPRKSVNQEKTKDDGWDR